MSHRHVKSTTCKNWISLREAASSPNVSRFAFYLLERINWCKVILEYKLIYLLWKLFVPLGFRWISVKWQKSLARLVFHGNFSKFETFLLSRSGIPIYILFSFENEPNWKSKTSQRYVMNIKEGFFFRPRNFLCHNNWNQCNAYICSRERDAAIPQSVEDY